MTDDVIDLLSESESSEEGKPSLNALRTSCMKSIISIAKVDEARANQLLDQTAPEHEHKGEEPWIEACLLQLAIDNEIEAETAELGLAMQASLDNIERLREQYCEDDIQSIVSAFADSDVGLLLKTYEFLEEMDASVVKSFLEFEKRCKKWYSNSAPRYFKKMAEDMKLSNLESKQCERVMTSTMKELQAEIYAYKDPEDTSLPTSFLPYHTNQADVIDLDE